LGGAIAVAGVGVMFVHPGAVAGAAVSVADALILIAIVAAWRRDRDVRLFPAMVGLSLSLLTAAAAAAYPAVAVGPIFDVVGRSSWLGDAVADGLLGWALARRGGWGTAAAIGCLARCAGALMLVVRPAKGEQAFNWLYPWQVTAIWSGVLVAVFFARVRALGPTS
jgi:hypothetical protein